MRKQFRLPLEMSEEVRTVDAQMLNAEAYVHHRALWEQLGSHEPGHFAVEAIVEHHKLSTFDAVLRFMDLWHSLMGAKA